jgi:hypothetical protein
MISDRPDAAGSRTASAAIDGFPQFSRGGVLTLSAYATKKYRSFVEAGMGHFQFRSPHKPARRIPVSETGYRSHFADMDAIEAADSPEDYARSYALSLIRRVPREQLDFAEAMQPSLLSLLD